MIRTLLSFGVALGLALAAAALGIRAVALFGPLPEERTDAGAGGGGLDAAGSVPEGFEAPPLGAFKALFARPLFRMDRRPPKPTPAPVAEREPVALVYDGPETGEEEDDPPPAALRGVVLAGRGGFALVEPAEGGPAVRLAAGESLDGWRLIALTAATATFERDGQTVALRLEGGGGMGKSGMEDEAHEAGE